MHDAFCRAHFCTSHSVARSSQFAFCISCGRCKASLHTAKFCSFSGLGPTVGVGVGGRVGRWAGGRHCIYILTYVCTLLHTYKVYPNGTYCMRYGVRGGQRGESSVMGALGNYINEWMSDMAGGWGGREGEWKQ